MKAYLRISPLLDEHKAHYTDGQFRAFLHVITKASRQEPRGRFGSVVKLRALLGRLARHVPFLVEQGDLAAQPDGTLYVAGWDEWQEGDLTVRDRMEALRNRRRNGTVTGSSPTATRVSVSVSDGSVVTESTPPTPPPPSGWDGDDLWRLYSGITRSVRLKPSVVTWLERMETTYTAPVVAGAMRAAYTANPDISTLLSRTEASCVAAAKQAEANIEKTKRSDRIVAGMVARRLETYRNTGKWDEAWGPRPE